MSAWDGRCRGRGTRGEGGQAVAPAPRRAPFWALCIPCAVTPERQPKVPCLPSKALLAPVLSHAITAGKQGDGCIHGTACLN